MAKLDGNIIFTGSLGNITAFKRRDLNETILRQKQGIDGMRVKTDPAFKNTRLNNTEFGGCAKAGSRIRKALSGLTRLTDFNISSRFNGICKSLQCMDLVNDWGQRSVLFSKEGKVLEGFSLTGRSPFNEVVTSPIHYNISRKLLSANIAIPKLVPGINFFIPAKKPFYRFVIVLGILPDLIYRSKDGYGVANSTGAIEIKAIETQWFIAEEILETQALEITLNRQPALQDSESLMLSIGLEPGEPGPGGELIWAKYTGCAQILAIK